MHSIQTNICKGYLKISVVNESDVKQTKSISSKPLSIIHKGRICRWNQCYTCMKSRYYYCSCFGLRKKINAILRALCNSQVWSNTNVQTAIAKSAVLFWLLIICKHAAHVKIKKSYFILKCQIYYVIRPQMEVEVTPRKIRKWSKFDPLQH